MIVPVLFCKHKISPPIIKIICVSNWAYLQLKAPSPKRRMLPTPCLEKSQGRLLLVHGMLSEPITVLA